MFWEHADGEESSDPRARIKALEQMPRKLPEGNAQAGVEMAAPAPLVETSALPPVTPTVQVSPKMQGGGEPRASFPSLSEMPAQPEVPPSVSPDPRFTDLRTELEAARLARERLAAELPEAPVPAYAPPPPPSAPPYQPATLPPVVEEAPAALMPMPTLPEQEAAMAPERYVPQEQFVPESPPIYGAPVLTPPPIIIVPPRNPYGATSVYSPQSRYARRRMATRHSEGY